MAKEAVFTMKLEPELRDEFMAEAQALDRPASQVVRDLMREFVRRQREAREHEAFVRRKVEAGRRDMRAGRRRTHAEVEADFASRRTELLHKAGEAGA
jgi:predicted transcriptional regulator